MKNLISTATGILVLGAAVGLTGASFAQNRSGRMEERTASADPGTQHQRLAALTGSWKAEGQCWKNGKAEPVTGAAVSNWVLGNRFIQCKANWSEAGKTVEAIGLSGYDNQQGKFVSSWADTFGTGIKAETGDYDAATNAFTYTGEFKDDQGRTVRCRKVLTIQSDSKHTMTGYQTEPGKSETKMVEITFTRAG
ncbi:MAG: DUF1579 family protein [Phycisphaerales bacterium]